VKVNIEIDLTPDEAKELFVPSDKQSEFMTRTYDAYIKALNGMFREHIDPYNFTGINPKANEKT